MKILKKIKNFWDDESGMGVVEVVLIIIVLVGLVMLFKKQITSLVNIVKVVQLCLYSFFILLMVRVN